MLVVTKACASGRLIRGRNAREHEWHVECSWRSVRNTILSSAATLTLFASLAACSGGGDDVDDVESAVSVSALLPTECDPAARAGGGFVSTAIPTSTGSFSVTFRVTPELDDGAWPPIIDAVIGLSDGSPTSFADLGPAVRFNRNGTIDVRNGGEYGATEPFPYTVHDGPYELRVDVDVAAHTYSVWARHLDTLAKPMVALATGYAFRNEQQTTTRLDTLSRYVDGEQGGVTTCALTYQGALPSAGAAPAFVPRSALIRHPRPALVDQVFYRGR